jgi:hypothetical protein
VNELPNPRCGLCARAEVRRHSSRNLRHQGGHLAEFPAEQLHGGRRIRRRLFRRRQFDGQLVDAKNHQALLVMQTTMVVSREPTQEARPALIVMD